MTHRTRRREALCLVPKAIVGLGLTSACAALVAAVLGACGSEQAAPTPGVTSPEAGAEGGDAGPAVFAVAPPAAPAAPVLTPCPAGWRVIENGTQTECEPWPVGGPQDCAADQAHFPGEPGCTTIGEPCPAGDWSDAMPAGASILRVSAGAAPGGDGSKAAPFATIGAALAAASSGTIVAVGKGTFDESVAIPSGVTLWGACVKQTRIASSSPSDTSATLDAFEPGAVVRNLAVGGARVGLAAVGAGASLDLEGVLVDGATNVAIEVGTTATLTGSSVVVRSTVPASDGTGGKALAVLGGSQATLKRVAIEHNRELVVFAQDKGTKLALSDVAVRDSQSAATQTTYGSGAFYAVASATIELTRGVIEHSREAALNGYAGTVIRATDVVIRDTLAQEIGKRYGDGGWFQDGARLEASRVRIEDGYQYGVLLTKKATAELSDVIVRNTRSELSDDASGNALHLEQGASAHASRVLFESSREAGVSLDMSKVTAEDLTVRDTHGQDVAGAYGRALQMDHASSFTGQRLLFEQSRDLGILVGIGGTATFDDLTVRDNLGDEKVMDLGRGLQAQDGCTVVIHRALFQRCKEVGISAYGDKTSVQASDVDIEDTLPRACGASFCADSAAGIGVVADLKGALAFSAFRIAKSALCAAELGPTGEIDLKDGEILGNPVGIDVQNATYDLARLSEGVVFHDNGVNFDATALPIPSAGQP